MPVAELAEFTAHRPLLLGLAYRFLGSMWDAEDVVQEAWLRWSRVEQAEVRDTRAFLVTTVSRLALDQLRSARVKRETYPGPWLPEPVDTAELGPLETAEQRDTLGYATLHLMERLTPRERAVYVLREAFSLPYDEIAEVVGASVATCRQDRHRAGARLTDGRDRFPADPAEHDRLLSALLVAASTGDLDALTATLADDVTAWTDGGGMVNAARRPVVGRRKVVALVLGLVSKYPVTAVRAVRVNGGPAVLVTAAGQDQVMLVDVADGKVCSLFTMRNPDKLTRVG